MAQAGVLALVAGVGLRVRAARVASEGFIDLHLDEDGLFKMPDGVRRRPWDGLEPEATLPEEAFVCHDGAIFGITVPGKSPGQQVFFYVKNKLVTDYWPVQIYMDLSDARKQFFLYPPIDGLTERWRLHFRRASFPGHGGFWVENRLYEAGEEHPCGPAGDWEVRAQMELADIAFNGHTGLHWAPPKMRRAMDEPTLDTRDDVLTPATLSASPVLGGERGEAEASDAPGDVREGAAAGEQRTAAEGFGAHEILTPATLFASSVPGGEHSEAEASDAPGDVREGGAPGEQRVSTEGFDEVLTPATLFASSVPGGERGEAEASDAPGDAYEGGAAWEQRVSAEGFDEVLTPATLFASPVPGGERGEAETSDAPSDVLHEGAAAGEQHVSAAGFDEVLTPATLFASSVPGGERGEAEASDAPSDVREGAAAEKQRAAVEGFAAHEVLTPATPFASSVPGDSGGERGKAEASHEGAAAGEPRAAVEGFGADEADAPDDLAKSLTRGADANSGVAEATCGESGGVESDGDDMAGTDGSQAGDATEGASDERMSPDEESQQEALPSEEASHADGEDDRGGASRQEEAELADEEKWPMGDVVERAASVGSHGTDEEESVEEHSELDGEPERKVPAVHEEKTAPDPIGAAAEASDKHSIKAHSAGTWPAGPFLLPGMFGRFLNALWSKMVP